MAADTALYLNIPLDMHIYDTLLSTLLNQLTVQETHRFARQLYRKACEGKSKPSESTTSVMIARTISSYESSSLANCGPLNVHVSVHCCLFLYSPSKKLVFVPTASAMAGAHRDCTVLASVAQ